jgi:hypothetical protein
VPNIFFTIGMWLANAAVAIGLPASFAIAIPGFLAAYGPALLIAGVGALLYRPPEIPKPEDGRYNLKQPVPFAPIVLGRTRKGGDYLGLEERDGVAYHVIAIAYHRVNAFLRFWLHDEVVTLDGTGKVIDPPHFKQKVKIDYRLGLDAETAYGDFVSAIPEAWTPDHRGDGVATLFMSAASVGAEKHRDVYPNNMPQPSTELEGLRIKDPRDGVVRYTENLGVHAVEVLRARWGFRLKEDRIDLAEAALNADVCDDIVKNRAGEDEPRYHGGGWFRTNVRPAEIMSVLQQSADFQLYLKADGRVGFHPSTITETDVHLTADDLISFSYVRNTNPSTAVLAVRARYTSADHAYVTADAAVYGDVEALSDDDRTKLLELTWVQRHNHSQRLQALELQRIQAPNVAFSLPWAPKGKRAMRKRFIRLSHPRRGIVRRLVEVTGGGVNLQTMRVSLTGRLLPDNFYAPPVEGIPPPVPTDIERQGLVPPSGISISLDTQPAGGGIRLAYADIIWDTGPDSVRYRVQRGTTSAVGVAPPGPFDSVLTEDGEEEARMGPLTDNAVHAFRVQTISGGGRTSDWSDWHYFEVLIDSVAPAGFASATVTEGLGNAVIGVTAPSANAPRYAAIYHQAGSGGMLDREADFVDRVLMVPGGSFTYPMGDTATSNFVENGDFASVLAPWSGTNWAQSAGTALKTPGTTSQLTQGEAAIATGSVVRMRFDIVGRTAGQLTAGITSVPNQNSTAKTTNGRFRERFTAGTVSGTSLVRFVPDINFDGAVDNVIAFFETAGCLSQGNHTWWVIPENGSFVEGPVSGPIVKTID